MLKVVILTLAMSGLSACTTPQSSTSMCVNEIRGAGGQLLMESVCTL